MKVPKVLHVLMGAALALTTLSGCEDEISAPVSEEGGPATALALTHVTVPSTTYGMAEDIGYLGLGVGSRPIMGEGGHVVGTMNTFAGPVAAIWDPATKMLTDLGMLEDCSRSLAVGVSENGVVAGNAELCPNHEARPFRWTRAAGFERLLPPGFRWGSARAINRHGVIAGILITESDELVLSRWNEAGVLETATPPSDCASPFGLASDLYINEAGTTAGSITCLSSIHQSRTTPFVWPVGGSLILMDATWGVRAFALGLNNRGNVTGARTVNGFSRGFFWTPGSTDVEIGTLGGPTSHPRGISDLDEVAGFSPLDDDLTNTRAFRWTLARGIENLGLPSWAPSGGTSGAVAIGSTGIIVGISGQRAFRWTLESGYEALTVGVFTHAQALSVNTAGEVAGFWNGHTSSLRWVRWSMGPTAPGLTPVGTAVAVTPTNQTTGGPAPATITFDQVTTSGTTTVTSGTMGGPTAPTSPSVADFKLGEPPTYYDITTDASFTGSVTICIDYSGTSYGNESKLKLLHFNEGTQEWEDISTSLDTSTRTICGTTTSFSPFLVVEENVAPVVTTLSIPPDPTAVGVSLSLIAGFTDENTGDTHTAVIDWGDGTTSSAYVVESGGSGSLAGNHAYSAPGVYTVRVSVTDEGGESGGRLSTEEILSYLVIYDPSAGFVTGGGWVHSPVGACGLTTECKALEGKATFGFVSRYKKGATVPDGNTEFEFKAGELTFKSTSYQWLVIAGPKGQYKGVGQIDGAGEFNFMLTVNDGQVNGGGGVDRFRIKIWNDVVGLAYDSQLGAADDADASTALGGGSIVIHKK